MYFTPIVTELYAFPALDSLVSILINLPSASFLALWEYDQINQSFENKKRQ